MNLFGLGSKDIRVEAMAAGCKIGESYVQSSICEVSSRGMTCLIPSSRIRGSLIEMLDTCVSVSIDNMLLDGILSWYTIEDSAYRIGIIITPKHRASWKRIYTARCRESMIPATQHSHV